MPMLPELQEKFALNNNNQCHIDIVEGSGGLPLLKVNNKFATAEIYLQGAQLTHFQPHGEKPVLWLSDDSRFEPGAAIRGGVPICWPWFSAHPYEASLPSHGFARISNWTLDKVDATEDGSTRIQLSLTDNESTRSIWSFKFDLVLSIIINETLEMRLTTSNRGAVPFTYTEALHSYFAVDDIHHTRIEGLQNTIYADKMDDMNRHGDSASITFAEETDRVYVNTTTSCSVCDDRTQRQIQIEKTGSLATVVWNPWISKSAAMKDFRDDEWQHMVCVETANFLEHAMTLEPTTSHTMMARIGIVRP